MSTRTTWLTNDQARMVFALADAVAANDGVYPFSEEVRLRIRGGKATDDVVVYHVLARRGGELCAYGQVSAAPGPDGLRSGELAVHPNWRHQRVGTSLGRHLADAAGGKLRIWAHGDLAAAQRVATRLRLRRSRQLLILGRSLADLPSEPALPAGVGLRSFVVGQDEQTWLQVNARAFTHLPDQGGMTIADLSARETESWFDPAGFILAVREDSNELLGFHWTKIHPAGNHRGPYRTEALGEVYVLGVDPSAHGIGLGKALTLAGLQYLRSQGLSDVMLYVDASNTGAVALYRKLGFVSWSADAEYRSI